MDSLQLIESVKEFSFLFNQHDQLYSDTDKREAVWRDIGTRLNLSHTQCKKHWNNLRDSYRRVLRKRKEAEMEKPPGRVKPWKYENAMSFLYPFLENRKGITSSAVTNFSKDESCEDEEVSISSFIDEGNTLYSPIEVVKEPAERPTPISKRSPVRRRKVNKRRMTASAACVNSNLIKKFKGRQQFEKSTDEIELFFSSIVSTVKKLSPYNQALAKARIFSIISKLEISEISQRDPLNDSFPVIKTSPCSSDSNIDNDNHLSSQSLLQPLQVSTNYNSTEYYEDFSITTDVS